MCSVVKKRKALKSIVYKRITETYVTSTKKKKPIKKYRNSRKANEIDTFKRRFFIENSKIENSGKYYQGRNKSTNNQNDQLNIAFSDFFHV